MNNVYAGLHVSVYSADEPGTARYTTYSTNSEVIVTGSAATETIMSEANTNCYTSNQVLQLSLFKRQDFSASSTCTSIRLLHVIGRGSFGVVHRAIWQQTLVAAKVIPTAREMKKELTGAQEEISTFM